MTKNKTNAQNLQYNMQDEDGSDNILETMRPSDELQVYYNDAYMKEKQRFNDMFGVIEGNEPAPDAIKKIALEQEKVDLSAYVPLQKYKKAKTAVGVLAVVAIACAAAAAYFALKFFSII